MASGGSAATRTVVLPMNSALGTSAATTDSPVESCPQSVQHRSPGPAGGGVEYSHPHEKRKDGDGALECGPTTRHNSEDILRLITNKGLTPGPAPFLSLPREIRVVEYPQNMLISCRLAGACLHEIKMPNTRVRPRIEK